MNDIQRKMPLFRLYSTVAVEGFEATIMQIKYPDIGIYPNYLVELNDSKRLCWFAEIQLVNDDYANGKAKCMTQFTQGFSKPKMWHDWQIMT